MRSEFYLKQAEKHFVAGDFPACCLSLGWAAFHLEWEAVQTEKQKDFFSGPKPDWTTWTNWGRKPETR